MFSIEIFSETVPEDFCGSESHERGHGRIQIGNFKESIFPLLSYWSKEKYKNQWMQAIQRVLAKNNAKAALIVDMPSPPYIKNSALVWWPIYRVKESVYVQEQWKSLRRFKKPFDSYEIYDYVRPRRTITEEGDQISEWQVTLDDLKVFLERLKKQ